jgi:hypothetical protein
VSLLYDLSEKEDPFIYARVKSRLDELTKMCGPGTDFYVLLNEDTMSQLEQAQDYRGINEVKLALGNYKQALNGLRILAFFSKDDRFRKMENETYREIIEYYEQLQEKIRKLEAINEFETAKRISNLLSRYRVSPRKSQIDAQSPDRYEGEGDDVSTIRAVFTQPIKTPEGQEENAGDASGENDSGMEMSVSGKDSSTDASMQEPEDAAGKDDSGKKEKDTPSPAVEAEDLKETEKPEASPAAKNAAEGKKSETVSKKKPAETVRQDDTVAETETTSGSEKPQKEPDLDIQFTPAPQDQA